MHYYSTNKNAPEATLEEAVIKGLAPDKGLYMPTEIHRLPDPFFHHIEEMSLQEIAFVVASAFFNEDIEAKSMQQIINESLNFEIPLVKVTDTIYSLELFHGPTAAFKDIGARFMARVLAYFMARDKKKRTINILVATSGDTGSAVANGFLDVPGIRVFVLYPKGKVSDIQEKQFTTLGHNITALEINGTFDDCQRLVKEAFMDEELNKHLFLTSANSINVVRFLPQMFYYFHAYAQYKRAGNTDQPVMCVPSGNLGNLTAGLFAKRMGLPIKRFIAANNCNDIFLQYLQTGQYMPRPSIQTIANAMDVGDPSNFARILDLYNSSHESICKDVEGVRYKDNQIAHTVARVYDEYDYLLDPHGACGYEALCDLLKPDEKGIFLETAHPAKFKDTVEPIIGEGIMIPASLRRFMSGVKQTEQLSADYRSFRKLLMDSIEN